MKSPRLISKADAALARCTRSVDGIAPPPKAADKVEEIPLKFNKNTILHVSRPKTVASVHLDSLERIQRHRRPPPYLL